MSVSQLKWSKANVLQYVSMKEKGALLATIIIVLLSAVVNLTLIIDTHALSSHFSIVNSCSMNAPLSVIVWLVDMC